MRLVLVRIAAEAVIAAGAAEAATAEETEAAVIEVITAATTAGSSRVIKWKRAKPNDFRCRLCSFFIPESLILIYLAVKICQINDDAVDQR